MNKKTEKLVRMILKFLVMFCFNLIPFSLCMIFTDITFRSCTLYSLINALWMTFMLLPLIEKITHQEI